MIMRRFVLLMALTAGWAAAALTTITDTIHRADGSLASGSFNVSWQAFTNASGQLIPAGNIRNVPIVAGVFTVQLEPNVGASPAGTSYTVVYSISGSPVQSWRWYVPVSFAPVGLNVVQFPAPGLIGTSAVVSPTQLLQAGATLGQAMCWLGAYWGPGSCGGGGGGGGAFSAITSGTNTSAAMVVGSGATLDLTGSGTINANKILGTSITGLSGSGGKLLETSGTLTTGNLLSSSSGNAVDSGITAANVMQTSTAVACGQEPAFTGDVTKTSGSCATTVTKTNGTPFGTAATANIGTIGSTIPLLNGINTWSGIQNFGQTAFSEIDLWYGITSNSFQVMRLTNSGFTYNLRMGDGVTNVLFSNPILKIQSPSSLDAHSSASTLPNRTGAGSPVARDNCSTLGETYFQTDAIAGNNTWACTLAGFPGQWTLQGASGGGSVTHTTGPLSAGYLTVGNSGNDIAVLSSLGTATTVLHGNIAGNPLWAAVNLAADVTGILPGANGGLGTSSMLFSGPSGVAKTYTLPNASATILTSNAAVTMAQGGTGADFSAIAKGGLLVGTAAGAMGIKAVGTDGTVLTADAASTGGMKWAAVVGTGTLTSVATTGPITGGTITTTGTIACATCVTSAASLTANQLMLGGGSQASATLGSLGTTTTVLHGNAAGPPSYAAVVLTTDVTGILPVANGGTGASTLAAHGVLVGAGASAVAVTAAGTAGQVLTSNGASSDPTWQAAGSGTVTVYGAGSLTSTALVTGAGTTVEQTPCATCTLDGSGNLATPGGVSTGVGGSNAGKVALIQGTAPSITANAVNLYAPAAIATGFGLVMPSAAATGLVRGDNSAGVVTLSQAELSGDVVTSGSNAAVLATKYKVLTCQPGLGDGTNAITAATYLRTGCLNEFAATWTITSIKCFSDNNGTSTLNVTNGASTGLLTGAITCSNSWAAGTQSATTTIASTDYTKFTFVSDGTTKQTTWVITGTR